MSLAFKIAWRNLQRHKGKSLVIGTILLLGALLMTVGNGMVAGMEKGLSANIVELFTGDLMIISDEQEKNDILFDFNGKPLKVLKDYSVAKKILENQQWIKDYLPATAGFVLIFNSGSNMGATLLVGADINRYRKFFPNSFKVIEGRTFKTGERGVMISEESRKLMYESMDFWLVPEAAKLKLDTLPKDAHNDPNSLEIRRDFVFMGASESNTSVDVRVPVKAIFNFKALNKIWGYYGIIDLESFREAHNYITDNNNLTNLSDAEKQELETEQSEMDLFDSDTLLDQSTIINDNLNVDELKSSTKTIKKVSNLDAGSYNLIFLKISSSIPPEKAIEKLNTMFKQNNLKMRAISWKDAVGMIGSMAVFIKTILNVFIMFIFFVAIIVIMNTLGMAALERVSELAMMRAIGARKFFVRSMFVYETGILSFFFGGIGIALGIIIISVLQMANISTTNEFLQLVYGGDSLNPLFTMGDLGLGIVELAFVTFLAAIYPLQIVGKIVPLDAITRD